MHSFHCPLQVLETQYSGDTILLIFPDGTGPALLQCLIGGIPLNRVHEFEFKSGEIRLNINYENTQQYVSYVPSEEYLTYIKNGEEELRHLRENPEGILNVREQQYQVEQRLAEEKKVKEERAVQEKKEKEAMEKLEMKKMKHKVEEESGNVMDINAPIIAGLAVVGGVGAFSIFIGGETNEQSADVFTNSTTTQTTNLLENKEVPIISEEGQSLNEAPYTGSEASERLGGTNSSLLDINRPLVLPTVEPLSVQKEGESKLETAVETDVEVIASTSVNFEEVPMGNLVADDDDGSYAWLGALSEIMNEEDITDSRSN